MVNIHTLILGIALCALGSESMNNEDAVTIKNIVFDVGDVLFGYDKQRVHELIALNDAKAFFPLEEGIQILRDCYTLKQVDPSIRIFVLSNFAQKSFTFLRSRFPEIFAYFDGIVISEAVAVTKPHPLIYLHLLEVYNIKPHESIFIDDKHENVKGAQLLGMHGIICTDFSFVRQELIRYGVLNS